MSEPKIYETYFNKYYIRVPKELKAELTGGEYVLTRGLKGGADIYSVEAWKDIEQRLSQLNMVNKGARLFSKFLLSNASIVKLKAGKILIGKYKPEWLQELLSGELVIYAEENKFIVTRKDS